MSADFHGWAIAHTAPDEDFEEGLRDAALYIDENMVCECCGVIYCLHDRITWLVALTPPPEDALRFRMEEEPPAEHPAARCDDCLMTATIEKETA